MNLRFFLILLLLLIFTNTKAQNNSNYDTLVNAKELEYEFYFMEGVSKKEVGEYEEAVKLFNMCLNLDSKSAVVRYELAQIYFLSNYIDESLYMIREAIKLNSNNIYYKLFLAKVYVKKSMVEKAAKVYADLIETYPETEKYYIVEANLYSSIEKWREAINVYDKYGKNIGISDKVLEEKLNLYSKLEDTKNFKKIAKQLAKEKADDNQYLIKLIELCFSYNYKEVGLFILNSNIKENPNSELQYYLCNYYLSENELVKADEYLKNILINRNLSLYSKIAYLPIYNAFIKNQINKYKITDYVDILSKEYPDSAEIKFLFVEVLLSEKKFREAQIELKSIISEDKTYYKAWETLFLISNELKDNETIAKYIKDAIYNFPGKPIFYLFYSYELLNEKKYNELLPILKKGYELSDESNFKTDFIYLQGEVYYNLDSVELAFSYFDKAIENNVNVAIYNNYAYYLTVENINLDLAEELSAKTIDIEPNNATYLDTYAWVLYKRKEYSQAKLYIEFAINNSEKKSSTLYDHYGDILYELNDFTNALKNWELALKCDDLENRESIESKINNFKAKILNEK